MIPNAKVCLYPRDPEEVVRLLAEKGKRALLLAGGTTAALSRDPQVDTLIDLTRLGLDTIERVGAEWVIGCNVRLQQLAEHAGLAGLYGGMLCEASAAAGSRPIRNMVTVGGNLIQLYRWSDPPVALLAMGARAELLGPDGERTLGLSDLLSRHPRQALLPAEILLRLRLSEPQGHWGGAFFKYARTAVDLAVVDAACALRLDEAGRLAEVRLVIGATRATPWRATAAEQVLVGYKPSAARIAQAARAAREATQTHADVRTTREYRERMVEVTAARTIELAARRAAAGQEGAR